MQLHSLIKASLLLLKHKFLKNIVCHSLMHWLLILYDVILGLDWSLCHRATEQWLIIVLRYDGTMTSSSLRNIDNIFKVTLRPSPQVSYSYLKDDKTSAERSLHNFFATWYFSY